MGVRGTQRMSVVNEKWVEQVGPELAAALTKKGYETLTQVQEAVLEPRNEGRDLRISSQTGSGKTVAIGLVIREIVGETNEESESKAARPRAIVITPTRELAKQVEEELRWLYAGKKLRVISVTGGTGYRDELRALRDNPAIIVGTPGRLLDHLLRKSIDASNVGAAVLDEADRMLDLGFRDDLLKIFATMPAEGRRTHLCSATFPREVLALADRIQKDPIRVEGTPHGAANTDIEHVIYLVHPKERVAAIVNMMLASGGGQTLIFARTRADVSYLAEQLNDAGFAMGMLSGEMEQPERTRALAQFKKGKLDALVATDVAARGIDVQDVGAVIHAEPPGDSDSYTHRSCRTGRAGKKGTSAILVAPGELVKTLRLLSRARVQHSVQPLPTAREILALRDEHLFEELTTATDEIDARSRALAERLIADDGVSVLARLLTRVAKAATEPRPLTKIEPPGSPRRGVPPPPPSRARGELGGGDPPRSYARESRRTDGPPRPNDRPAPRRGEGQPVRPSYGRNGDAPAYNRAPDSHAPVSRAPSEPRGGGGDWVAFRVSWGETHGADTRRLMAMLCRRGGIEGRDVGAIKVQRTASLVEIAGTKASEFEAATAKPDPRDPKIKIRRWAEE